MRDMPLMRDLAYMLTIFFLLGAAVFAGGPFRRRAFRNRQPVAPRTVTPQIEGEPPITYTLVETPHFSDGYWTRQEWPKEYKFSDSTWKLPANFAETYPYTLYVWDWPGRKESDRTWHIEEWKGVTPDKPKRWERIPSYSPYWPGQRLNL